MRKNMKTAPWVIVGLSAAVLGGCTGLNTERKREIAKVVIGPEEIYRDIGLTIGRTGRAAYCSMAKAGEPFDVKCKFSLFPGTAIHLPSGAANMIPLVGEPGDILKTPFFFPHAGNTINIDVSCPNLATWDGESHILTCPGKSAQYSHPLRIED
jgi:hypothetical protein